jgi:hypothetical protein
MSAGSSARKAHSLEFMREKMIMYEMHVWIDLAGQ